VNLVSSIFGTQYYYHSARMLVVILLFHRGWKAEST